MCHTTPWKTNLFKHNFPSDSSENFNNNQPFFFSTLIINFFSIHVRKLWSDLFHQQMFGVVRRRNRNVLRLFFCFRLFFLFLFSIVVVVAAEHLTVIALVILTAAEPPFISLSFVFWFWFWKKKWLIQEHRVCIADCVRWNTNLF